MKPVIIEFENIGQVLFDPSKKARCLTIYVKSAHAVRVAVPRCISLEQAKKIVTLRAGWIKLQQQKMALRQRLQQQSPPPPKIDYQQAALDLIRRLNLLADKYNLPFNKVTIRNQKTRWGSCSTKNNINLNINLAHLPSELIDYVLLHELTHTKVQNHSRHFWARLSEICPQPKILNKKLRKYSLLFTKTN